MSEPMKNIVGAILFLTLGLLQASPALARSDDLIQREIEAQIADSTVLCGTRIEVLVEQRLVVLTGQVRLYEQKLVSGRLAWTTLGVFEVDNEIRVVPKVPLTDAAIERKVQEIIKTYPRLHSAGVVVAVDSGVVTLQGSFSGIGDPVFLKHQVAEIEGVVDIKMQAKFLAMLSSTE